MHYNFKSWYDCMIIVISFQEKLFVRLDRFVTVNIFSHLLTMASLKKSELIYRERGLVGLAFWSQL